MTTPTAMGTATILRGDARHIPLADNTVDAVISSPPYFGLRSYRDGGEHYDGQIGDEPTPAEFVEALLEVTRECMRVLKDGGSLWVNLGDKYSRGSRPRNQPDQFRSGSEITFDDEKYVKDTSPENSGIIGKSLMGIPWRYAIACIDDLGLILRQEVIWSKCLSGGARVYARTRKGVQPIRMHELVRKHAPKDVELWNGEQWTRVVSWERTAEPERPLQIEFRSGERVGCTSNHRWPTARGVLRADELRVGDTVASSRLPEPDAPCSPSLLPDDDIGWLVGMYIAEGSRSGKTIQIAGHVNEVERQERLSRIATALDGRCNVYRTGENKATTNLTGSVIVGVIDRYVGGTTAKNKHLLMAAWQRSDAFLSAVVSGYLSGDGHFEEKNNRWQLGFTQNDAWANDMRTLSARLGAVCRLRRANHKGFGKSYPGWRGEWRWQPSAHHNSKEQGEIVAIRRSAASTFYDVEVADDPHLFALASGILTHNSNGGLPESVDDRARRNHEHWFHFTLKQHYYANMEAIKEVDPDKPTKPGRIPGSVWQVNTQPLHVPEELAVDHHAAFPIEWPRRIILGWTPESICTACGEGRRPKRGTPCPCGSFRPFKAIKCPDCGAKPVREGKVTGSKTVTYGEMCGCPDATAPTRRAVVLDPFGGTGTTALVAKVLGRDGISLDMSADYCRIGQWRTTDEQQIAKVIAANTPKPVKPAKGAKGKKLKPKAGTAPQHPVAKPVAVPSDQFALFSDDHLTTQPAAATAAPTGTEALA